MNEKLRAFLIYPPAFALVGALIAAPHIVHVLDSGRASGTVGQVARGELPSRNVTVTGLVHAERGVRKEVNEKNKEAKVSFFMPIYDAGQEDGPTQLVVHSYYNEVYDAIARPGQPMEFEGTVRDVLWESELDSESRDTLAAAHPLSPDVKVLELRGSFSGDWLWGYGAPLLGLVIGLLGVSGTQSAPKRPEAGA